MASFRKLPSGKWQAQVERNGVRKSKSFPSKQEAKDWAARTEYLIKKEPNGPVPTFGEVMTRYADTESPKRRGHKWEYIRLNKLCRDQIATVKITELQSSDLADWRDRRLGEVAPGSVHREMALMGSVLSTAKKEWGLIDRNPMEDVRKPRKPAPRDRLPTKAEFEALAISAGDDLTNATARAYHAFLFACETAMRAGEIVGLTWDDINGSVAHLPMTKNGSARDVPLSSEALSLLYKLPKTYKMYKTDNSVFGLDSRQLDVLWRKVRDRAGVEGLRFHDSRAYATTQLAKKVDVLTLARITGHKDIRMLMTYYRETAEDIAKKLG